MKKMATKRYSETVCIVDGKKQHIRIELTDNVKKIRHDNKMKRYSKNISKRKADDNKYLSIIVVKVKDNIASNAIGQLVLKDKLLKSNINPKHNAIPKLVENNVYDYEKPEHVILPKKLKKSEITNKEYTPMTRDLMNRGIVEAKIKKWDMKRNKEISSSPVEQRAFLTSTTLEQRKTIYKVLCEKYDIHPKLIPTKHKSNLKYGVVIKCEYLNSKGQAKIYKPFVNYHISTKEYAEKLLQQKVDYFKSHMKKNHSFLKGSLLYGGKELMFRITASNDYPKSMAA